MCALTPKVGLVLPHLYVWRGEPAAGRGSETPPAVIVVAATPLDGGRVLIAATPITNTEPPARQRVVPVPATVAAHLQLDAQRSWILCTEYNEFVWPSIGLAETPDGRTAYGMAPQQLTAGVHREMLAARSDGPLRAMRRTE